MSFPFSHPTAPDFLSHIPQHRSDMDVEWNDWLESDPTRNSTIYWQSNAQPEPASGALCDSQSLPSGWPAIYLDNNLSGEHGDHSNNLRKEDDNLTPGPTTPAHITYAKTKPAIKKIPNFPEKLHHLIQNPETDDLIRWKPDGKHFVVLNEQGLMDIAGFKTKKFSSLHRQMTGYEIHKKRTPADQIGAGHGVYYHKPGKFLRDRKDLLCQVKKSRREKCAAHAAEEDATPAPEMKTANLSGAPIGRVEAPQWCEEAFAEQQRQITVLTERVARLEPLVDFLWEKISEMHSHGTQSGGSSAKHRVTFQRAVPCQASTGLNMQPVANEGSLHTVLRTPAQGLSKSQTNSLSQQQTAFPLDNAQINHPGNLPCPLSHFSPNHSPTQLSAGPALSGLARDCTGFNPSAEPSDGHERALKRRRPDDITALSTSSIPTNSPRSLVSYLPHSNIGRHSYHMNFGTDPVLPPTAVSDNYSNSIDPAWCNPHASDSRATISGSSLAAFSTSSSQTSHFAQPMLQLPPRKPPYRERGS
ncbi:stress-responsive transcription factor hsf1 [Tulasnella sp. 331]|nr:stress-responsive transcription factor hsf1 [Tulasnella sp. 331]